MPKTEEAMVPATALAKLGVSPNDLASVLADYGISPEDVSAPKPKIALKSNVPQLCDKRWQIKDEYGNVITCESHTGPMILLADKGFTPGEKYDGYKGFRTFTVFVPGRGETVITIGEPEGDDKPQILRHLDGLDKGALFQVASVKTSSGNHVLVPVPVQDEAGTLL